MKRFTFMNGDDMWCVDNDDCFEEQSENYCGPAIERLAYYENLEMEGRLVVLPCKEGTKIYRVGYRISGNHVIEERHFSLTYFRPSDFGKTVFLTREEAEKALEGMK